MDVGAGYLRERLTELVARAGTGLGKGPGMVGLGFFEATLGAILAYTGKDLVGYAGVLTAINIGVYGGGAWKASAEAKNGNGNGAK